MKVYAFLPAKGTSERVLNKNNQLLGGEKLYINGLKILLKCKLIDKVFLDTESLEMHSESSYLACCHMIREKELATNATDGHSLFMNEVMNYDDADIYVQLLCTSPFIKPETIDEAIRKVMESDDYDSAIFMKKNKIYEWKNGCPCYDINHVPNSKDLAPRIEEGMSLYIVKKEAALKYKRRYGANPLFIYGDAIEGIDVNNKDELDLAKLIMEGKNTIEAKKLNMLKRFISSPILSDIMDDLLIEEHINAGGVISGLTPNIENKIIFGKAKTLKLRLLKDDEDYKGIYNALESYDTLTSNDVIVVENERESNAYFGDLNCRLAIRSGAQGVVINSVTRDVERVRSLDFPVWSNGYNAQDVRRRATVESINQPVTINGNVIRPGDYIFADRDAVVVVKSEYIDEIINKSVVKIKQENSVVDGIFSSLSKDDLLKENGGF